MNSSVMKEEGGNMTGYIAWIAMVVTTALAFLGTYQFKFSAPIQAIMWIGWFLVTLVLFYFTEQGKQSFLFAKESKIEMQKVVWPARSETIQTTMIVMAMVGITGFVLWAIDMGMMWVIGKITHLG